MKRATSAAGEPSSFDTPASARPGRDWVVLLAGGRPPGSAFEPGARRSVLPVAQRRLDGGRMLLSRHLEQAACLVPRERVRVVAAEDQAAALEPALRDWPAGTLLTEPVARGSLPAMLLAWLDLAFAEPEGRVLVIPADRRIGDPRTHEVSLRRLLRLADESQRIALLGARAAVPEPGRLWVMPSATSPGGLAGVRTFERPASESRAENLLSAGGLLYSGCFATSTRVLHRAACQAVPHLVAAFLGLEEPCRRQPSALDPDRRRELFNRLAPGHLAEQVLARSLGLLGVVPQAECGWQDLGRRQVALDARWGGAGAAEARHDPHPARVLAG
ncbi:MAG: hypothetical protein AAF533_12525 [Acidobacteriota bacterium]